MKLLVTLILASAYLMVAPVLTVETARSLHGAVAVTHNQNVSTHYKTHLTDWHIDADAAQS